MRRGHRAPGATKSGRGGPGDGHDTLASMAPRRPRPPKPSFCPVCDGALTDELATRSDPRCPSCQTTLSPVRVASSGRRVLATLVDLALVLVTAGPLAWLLAGWTDEAALLGGKSGLENLLRVFELEPGDLIRRLAPLAVMAGLYLGLFWGLSGRTPGQKLMRLRVIDASARRPGAVRTVVRVAVALVGLVPGALGWVWALFDLEHRAWHDRIAGTYVVGDG